MKLTADDLAADIRRINGNHAMGAGGLADALFAAGWGHIAEQQDAIAEYIAARDDYEAATKPPNSHALPRVVSQGDLRVLRYREARTALAARSPQHNGSDVVREAIAILRGMPTDRIEYSEELTAMIGKLKQRPAKPAGAVLLPSMEILERREVTPLCDRVVMGYTEAQMIAYRDACVAAAGGVPAMNKAESYRVIKRALGDAIADDAEISIHDLARCVVEAIPQQPTAEPAAEGATHWEENASYLLDRCKHSIRVREGGGPENLLSSLIATFMGMEQKLAIKAEPAGRGAALGFARPADLDGVRRNKDCDASIGVFVQPRRTDTHSVPLYTTPSPEPAVEATGTVHGQSRVESMIWIRMDADAPDWMTVGNTRVTISPTWGKSDA